jgi:hypothetical protein
LEINEMKCIAYTRPDGGLSIVHPIEDARLVDVVKIMGKRAVLGQAQPLDRLKAEAARQGVAIEAVHYAETDDQFIRRVIEASVPADAADVTVINSADLPDRASRASWRLHGGKVTKSARP